MITHSWHTQKFRPLGARMVVKLDPKAARYGVLEIPDDWRKQPQTATVISVGPGALDKRGRRHPITVSFRDGTARELRAGDRVFLGKYNGKPLPDPEDDYQGDREPRYYILEQREQKYRGTYAQAVELDDAYGFVESGPAEVSEWRAPK